MGNRGSSRRWCTVAVVAGMLSLLLCRSAWALPGDTDEPMAVTDLPVSVRVVGGTVAYGAGRAVGPAVAPPDSWNEAPIESDPVSVTWQDAPAAWEEPAQPDGYAGYVAEYNELYNTDGPSHEMPGWHDGYLETFYSDTVMRHYMSDQWTVDDDGFYRDGEYYIVGVDINDINPATGEPYQIGDVVETGKGQALVMDYGSGAKVHDFYVHGW